MIKLPYLEELVKRFGQKHIGDSADRLLSFASPTLCLMFATLVGTMQFFGSAMSCWVPGEFKGGWENYVRDHCYIQDKYVVHFDSQVFPTAEERKNHTQIAYYQWLPLYLFAMGCAFYLPSYIWRKLHKKHGINLHGTVTGASKLRGAPMAEKEKVLESITVSMLETIKEQAERPFYKCFGLVGGNYGRVLTYRYIMVKVLHVVVLVFNCYYVTLFLHQHDPTWAVKGVQSLITGDQWEESPSFPRVTLCDFKVFELGNVKPFTVQCILMMNAVNEKVFFVLWFWLLAMAVTTFSCYLHFFVTICSESSRHLTINRWLNHPTKIPVDAFTSRKFANLIGLDGFLTLYFIESDCGDRTVSDFATFLLSRVREMLAEQTETKPKSMYPEIALPNAPADFHPAVGPLPEKQPIV